MAPGRELSSSYKPLCEKYDAEDTTIYDFDCRPGQKGKLRYTGFAILSLTYTLFFDTFLTHTDRIVCCVLSGVFLKAGRWVPSMA